MDLQEVEGGDMDLTDLLWGRDRRRTVVKGVMNFRVSSNAGNFFTN